MLAVDGLTARYGAVVALRDVSLHVDDGELVALVGPNGAGKTTLLNTVAGLLRPAGGRVRLDGVDVTGAEPATLVRAGLALVPEHRRIFRDLTVGENLQLAGVTARPADRRRRLDEARAAVRRARRPVGHGGRLPVGRRGAAARRRPGADERPAARAARRADARPGADHGRRRLRPARRAARAGPHGARRRAERPAGPGDRRPWLRAAHRARSPSRAAAPSWPPTRTCSGTFVGRSATP